MISVSLYLWNWILVKYFNYKINIEIYYVKNHNFIGKVHNQTLACLAQKPAQLTKYSHSIAPWFVSTPHTRSFFESTAVTEQSSITPTPKKKNKKNTFCNKNLRKISNHDRTPKNTHWGNNLYPENIFISSRI